MTNPYQDLKKVEITEDKPAKDSAKISGNLSVFGSVKLGQKISNTFDQKTKLTRGETKSFIYEDDVIAVCKPSSVNIDEMLTNRASKYADLIDQHDITTVGTSYTYETHDPNDTVFLWAHEDPKQFPLIETQPSTIVDANLRVWSIDADNQVLLNGKPVYLASSKPAEPLPVVLASFTEDQPKPSSIEAVQIERIKSAIGELRNNGISTFEIFSIVSDLLWT